METQTNDNLATECECPICRELITTHKITSCQHTFCQSCLDKWLETNHTCPMCRTELNELDDKNKLASQQYIYTIPWAMWPEDMTPSGSMNYSRFDTIEFRLELRS